MIVRIRYVVLAAASFLAVHTSVRSQCATFFAPALKTLYVGNTPATITDTVEIVRDSTDEEGNRYFWLSYNGRDTARSYMVTHGGQVFICDETSCRTELYRLCDTVGARWLLYGSTYMQYLGWRNRVVFGITRQVRTYLKQTRIDDTYTGTEYHFVLDSFGCIAIRDYELNWQESRAIQGAWLGDRFYGDEAVSAGDRPPVDEQTPHAYYNQAQHTIVVDARCSVGIGSLHVRLFDVTGSLLRYVRLEPGERYEQSPPGRGALFCMVTNDRGDVMSRTLLPITL